MSNQTVVILSICLTFLAIVVGFHMLKPNDKPQVTFKEEVHPKPVVELKQKVEKKIQDTLKHIEEDLIKDL